ncbi:MAG TPA: hypothetical protein VKV77_12570 [Methylovirgula sp.]|nr:hypothetical protein [Methylovirgula sp.]
MQSRLVPLATLALAVTLTPAAAQPGPRCRPVYPGLILQSSGYQDPDGTYDSVSSLVRAVNGTPCGVECSRPWRQRIWFASPPGYVCW